MSSLFNVGNFGTGTTNGFSFAQPQTQPSIWANQTNQQQLTFPNIWNKPNASNTTSMFGGTGTGLFNFNNSQQTQNTNNLPQTQPQQFVFQPQPQQPTQPTTTLMPFSSNQNQQQPGQFSFSSNVAQPVATNFFNNQPQQQVQPSIIGQPQTQPQPVQFAPVPVATLPNSNTDLNLIRQQLQELQKSVQYLVNAQSNQPQVGATTGSSLLYPSNNLQLPAQLPNGTPFQIPVPIGHASSFALADLRRQQIANEVFCISRNILSPNTNNFEAFMAPYGDNKRYFGSILSSPSSHHKFPSRTSSSTNIHKQYSWDGSLISPPRLRPLSAPSYPCITSDSAHCLWRKDQDGSIQSGQTRFRSYDGYIFGDRFDQRRNLSLGSGTSRAHTLNQVNRHIHWLKSGPDSESKDKCYPIPNSLDGDVARKWKELDMDAVGELEYKKRKDYENRHRLRRLQPISLFDCYKPRWTDLAKATGPPLDSDSRLDSPWCSRGLAYLATELTKAKKVPSITVGNLPKRIGQASPKRFVPASSSNWHYKKEDEKKDTSEKTEDDYKTSVIFFSNFRER